MAQQHTDGWMDGHDPWWRPPRPPASTFHTCIGALSCPRGRRFPASWPCADSWGTADGETGMGGRGRGAHLSPAFSLVFFPSPWAVLRLGPGLTPLRAGDHQRKHPSPQPKRQRIHFQTPPHSGPGCNLDEQSLVSRTQKSSSGFFWRC